MKKNPAVSMYDRCRGNFGTTTLYHSDAVRLLLEHTTAHEPVAILSDAGALYATELGIANTYIGSALADCLYLQDYQDILDYLSTYEGKLFIDTSLFDISSRFADGQSIGQAFSALMNSRYTLVDQSETMHYYVSA